MAKDGTIKINTELDSSKAQAAMSKFSSVAKGALNGVTIAAGAVGTAITAMGGYAIKVGSDFEAGMSKVSAISGATGADLEALSNKAKEMGAKTKFSATEAASAFEYMAMAGWKTEDMLNGIEGVMNLAAASGEDLSSVSDIVTDAITAFGLSAKDSAHFADVLAKAASSSNTNVGKMGATFKYAAPIAGSLKYSIEDTATAIGLLANAGIKGEQAGTTLRSIMTRLVTPTDEAAAALDNLGISVTNSDGTMKPLLETLKDLRGGFSGLDDSQKASYASSIAGQEAMSGLLAIVGASDADFNTLVAAINDADGAAENMAGTMQDNLPGSLTILKSSLEGFGIKIYEKIQEPLREAADAGIDCVNRLSAAFDSGGLNGVVEEAGKIFDEFTDRIADTNDAAEGVIVPLKNMTKNVLQFGRSAAPIAAKTIKTLAENFDTLVPLVTAGYVAFKTYGKVTKIAAAATKANAVATALLNKMEKANALQLVAVNGGLTIRQTLMGIYNGQLTIGTAATALFTKAQLALNTAMAANPIGLVAAAIGALAAGTIAYTLVTDDAIKKTYGLSKEQKKLCKSIDETTDKVNQLKDARDENIKSATSEIDTTDALWTELQGIVDQNGKVKAGYEARAEYITGQLSQALGIEMDLQDGVIQGYKDQIDTINQLIETQRAQATLEAMKSDYETAIQEKTGALQNYLQAQKESTQAGKELSDAQADLAAITAQANEETKQYGVVQSNTKIAQEEAQDKVDQLATNYKKLSESTRDAKNDYQFYQDTIKQYEGLSAAIVSGDSQKIQDALLAISADFKKFGEVSDTELKNQAVKASENMALLGDAIKNGTVDATDSAVAEMANMAARSLGELAKLPEGAAGVAAELDPAIIGQLASLSGSLNAESKKAVSGFIEGLSGVDDETREKFENAVKGAIEGSEFGDEVASKAKELGKSYLDALRDILEVHSPSEAVKRIFAQTMPGASKGLDEGKDVVLEKASSFVSEFLGKFTESGLGEKLKEFGSNAMSFFGVAINSQKENIDSVSADIADSSNQKLGSADTSDTGSRKGLEYDGGLLSTAGKIISTAIQLADTANDGMGSTDTYHTGANKSDDYNSGLGSADTYSTGVDKAEEGRDGLGSVDAYNEGYNFTAGFGNGASGYDLFSVAYNIGRSALDAIKSALGIKSPSREAKKVGKFFSQGLGIGIDENKDYAVSKANELANDTLDALNMDAMSIDLSDIDIPDAMARISMAIDDSQVKVSDRIVSSVQAKERSSTDNLVEALNKSFEIDYKRLGKEMAKRPLYVSATLDNRELIKVTAVPMEQELKKNSNLKTMLNGGRP